ncbi:diguanylate cyclase (GGDEF)-like protein/PAS domain S-box-containing protein [Devosia sp. UYZn731]|uniref:diguanylate cyclase domain-containing protein n=1 Tax=Devosia sp. UYZn731 TaxID=3156345 RepID=UPI00339B42E2
MTKNSDVLPGSYAIAAFRPDGMLCLNNHAFEKMVGGCTVDTHISRFITIDMVEILRVMASLPDANVSGIHIQIKRQDGLAVDAHVIPSLAATAGMADLVLQFTPAGRALSPPRESSRGEARLNFALMAALQGVWDHDLKNRQLYFSPSWFEMRGMKPSDPVDGSLESWLQRVHPDDHEHVIQATRAHGPSEREVWVFEYRERHRGGRYMWIQSRGRHVSWDGDGNATRTLGTDTDISERKEAERQLRLLSGRLDVTLQAGKIGVWELDPSTGIFKWDARTCQIYGTEDRGEAVIRSEWEAFIHPGDRARAEADFLAAVAVEANYNSTFRIVLADGQTKHVRSAGRYFPDQVAGGRFLGAIWDISNDVARADELEVAKALADTQYSELQRAQQQLQHAALHDHLTNLPNRRYLEMKLLEVRARHRTDTEHLAILHIDLDHFKKVNDTFGHAAGDQVLCHVADVLRNRVRPDDFVARVGGDEFIVLSHYSDGADDLRSTAAHIIQALRKAITINGRDLHVGASIGIACSEDDSLLDAGLFQRADLALYRAKHRGRNRYAFAHDA